MQSIILERLVPGPRDCVVNMNYRVESRDCLVMGWHVRPTLEDYAIFDHPAMEKGPLQGDLDRKQPEQGTDVREP